MFFIILFEYILLHHDKQYPILEDWDDTVMLEHLGSITYSYIILSVIFIAWLQWSCLAQYKYANLTPEGPLWRVTITVVVTTATVIATIFLFCQKP